MAFGKLKQLEQDGATPRPFTFTDLVPPVVIMSRPATEANKPFMNESLRRAAERNRGGRRPPKLTTDTVAASRAEDIEMLARFCVTGWGAPKGAVMDGDAEVSPAEPDYGKPIDDDGHPVDFTKDQCHEFFKALPTYVFDAYRTWATEPTNFVGGADLGEP